MSIIRQLGMLPVCVACAIGTAWGADKNVFELGSVTVRGERQDTPGESRIDGEDLLRYDTFTVGAAVNTQPGVTLSKNSRNEDMVYVRGFDPRQVPLFLDGIPLYVPYDGYVDFGRFTTFDLSEIRVAKGAASLLYGPNIMGGAINLISRRPTRELEGDVRLGYASGHEKMAALNMGTNQGLWYLQAGLSYLEADTFRLGKGFTDHKTTPTDTGHWRENADRKDTRASVKFGLTPNATDEYAIGYAHQEGRKGNPVYTGRSDSKPRYWRWPYWDKDSVYFLSSTDIGQHHTLKTRVYWDQYKNGLDMYKDDRYEVTTGPRSTYEDTTYGASVEFITRAFRGHEFHVAAHYKDDRHKDPTPEATKRYRDVTTSIAFEDLMALGDRWRLRVGADYEKREAREVYHWPTGSTHAANGLAELIYDYSENHEFFASVAHKTRFPTIKDRYSAKMGTALPNPDLRPEVARHVELGWRGVPWQDGHAEVSLFYSSVTDLIQNEMVVGNCVDRKGKPALCDHAVNIGRARVRGFEVDFRQQLGERWEAGLAYTWIQRHNLSDPDVPLTDVPRHRVFAHLGWKPTAHWTAQATLEAESGRKVGFEKSYIDLPGFAVLGLKATFEPRKDISLGFGVRNVMDKYYELADGYPMPGRTWFVNGMYRF
ncbi:MAG: TonB-dependent receptor [Castellaniella sp.]|uniref:TonB-dependent receptor plug domain-containing protein n=1 Tax=Castellaniella sp. TaxID=1955812 RepID=UPI002A359E36|nr:TonB-dependent receptor [Castellaniella sp.]MDY0309637.1 TonB-dependent receptor [Castellaniella sp.]